MSAPSDRGESGASGDNSASGALAAIVLAGGRSMRFGRDKLAEPVDGRPLLHHAIEAVRAVALELDIVVVLAPGAAPHLPAGVRAVHDAMAYEGPLAGVVVGLGALAPSTERVLVVAGDMPDLVPDVLRAMDARLQADATVQLVWLEDDRDATNRPRPLPAMVRREAALLAADALLANGERRLRALGDRLVTHVIESGTWRALDPAAATLRDVDVPEDLPPTR
jgi:molybdopterin-guanine dinucleotide biosynthesis protein A